MTQTARKVEYSIRASTSTILPFAVRQVISDGRSCSSREVAWFCDKQDADEYIALKTPDQAEDDTREPDFELPALPAAKKPPRRWLRRG